MVRLNALCSLARVTGDASVVAELEALGDTLASYAPYHLALAETYHRLGRPQDAEAALKVAIGHLQNPLLRSAVLEKIQRWSTPTSPGPTSQGDGLRPKEGVGD